MHKTMNIAFIMALVLLLSGCSGFHVKVIDQHGDPVPDVFVRVGSLANLFLVSGGRTDFYTTSSDGRFKLGGPRVSIELIEKNGYEFGKGKGFGSISIYANYGNYNAVPVEPPNSYSNPYYILAWKREAPELLVGSEGLRRVTLTSDDDFYKINFTDKGISRVAVGYSEDIETVKALLLVRYKESDEIVLNRQRNKEMHPWELTLMVPRGGLIETLDIIRNLAPEAGYKPQWTIRSSDLPYVDTVVTRRFYIKSQDGQIYGQFVVRFLPYRYSLEFKPHWLNFNASRNLTRPKKYIYCKPREFVAEDCSLDDFDP
ncbi:MAG TPA: hypothetical protein ENI98_05855 [Gammaproteobacteria bacterium]|nr:hypothetical protein [Gammaproteobacteria bacterium]